MIRHKTNEDIKNRVTEIGDILNKMSAKKTGVVIGTVTSVSELKIGKIFR